MRTVHLRNAAAMPRPAELEAILQENREDVERIGAADLVVGIPTYNHRETMGPLVEAAIHGLQDQPSSLRTVIVHADGGSKDGTAEHLREVVGTRVPLIQIRYPVYPLHRLSSELSGIPGRQEALRTILMVVRQLGARACAVVDAEVQNATPDWIERLVEPLLSDEVDLLVPCYLRNQFDGMIGAAIVNPFTRALYGKRVRQTAGADLAFSGRLAEFFCDRESANGSTLDPWSPVAAICGGYRVGQTFLGPRIVQPRELSGDLGGTLSHALAAVFEQMNQTAAFWQKVRGSEPVPWFGPPLAVNPEAAQANAKRMIDSFRLGCEGLCEIWGRTLPPAALLELRRMAQFADEKFRFPDDLWARTVYDFALGYHQSAIDRDHLLQALTPLYLGWVASLLTQVGSAGPDEVEERLERLSMQFEAQKRYLISRWRWPDRFNP